MLQEVRARAQVDSLAALHDSVDSCDHLGGPIEFDVDAEGTKEAFEVDILSIVRENERIFKIYLLGNAWQGRRR